MQEYTVQVYANGNRAWYQDGKFHRLDGPAIEQTNGSKFWYQNDKRHRLDGPAVEDANGDKHWYQNGERHRLDGPAIEYANGDKRWCIDGEELTEEEFNEAVYSKKRTRRKIDYGDLTEEQYEQLKRKYTQDIIDGVCGIGINFITWMDSCGYKHEGRCKFIRKE